MAPFVRIVLRWLGGALVARGWIGTSGQSLLLDPDMVQVVCFALAGICGLLSEGWYFLARKRGWSK